MGTTTSIEQLKRHGGDAFLLVAPVEPSCSLRWRRIDPTGNGMSAS